MKIPQGLDDYYGVKYDDDNPLKLVHSIYGIVQAVRQFFKKLRDVLVEKLRFEANKNDQCLLLGKDGDESLVISYR